MPILTFSFDTGNIPLSRYTDGLAASYGYGASGFINATLPNETKADFSKRMMQLHIISRVRSYEENEAAKLAKASIIPITLNGV